MIKFEMNLTVSLRCWKQIQTILTIFHETTWIVIKNSIQLKNTKEFLCLIVNSLIFWFKWEENTIKINFKIKWCNYNKQMMIVEKQANLKKKQEENEQNNHKTSHQCMLFHWQNEHCSLTYCFFFKFRSLSTRN